jgi:L-ascorbate metabolism protein UlaG (beta-lactamase superfamily)
MTDLIQPVKSGADLAREVRDQSPVPGAIAVWWLGQSGFLFKTRDGLLVIDPYLSDHLTRKYEGTDKPHERMTAIPIEPSALGALGVDLILSSHKHSDHMDPGTLPPLMAAAPAAALGLPASLVAHAVASLGLPADRLIGLVDGQIVERAGFRVRAVPSAHEGLDTDADGRHLYLGFVVEAQGRRFYHGGDGLMYDGLVERLGTERFDALFLPINGRDPSRGVPGNMSGAEAVVLASNVRPRWLVPHHYEMFRFNTASVSSFEDEARRDLPPGVQVRAPRCAELWEIT